MLVRTSYDRVGRPVNTGMGYFVRGVVESSALAGVRGNVGRNESLLVERWKRVVWEVSRVIE